MSINCFVVVPVDLLGDSCQSIAEANCIASIAIRLASKIHQSCLPTINLIKRSILTTGTNPNESNRFKIPTVLALRLRNNSSSFIFIQKRIKDGFKAEIKVIKKAPIKGLFKTKNKDSD